MARQPIGRGLLHLQTDLTDTVAEAEFNRWCDEVHHREVLHVDGFLSLRRFEVVPGYRYADPNGAKILTLYQLVAPDAVDSPAHQEHGRTSQPVPPQILRSLTYLRSVYGQCFPESGSLTPAGVDATLQQEIGTALLHVMMDVEPAWELEFNAWYDEEHLPSLVAVPGFLSARRFSEVHWTPRDAASVDDAAGRHQYLAVYELEDPSAVDSAEYARACEMTPWTEKLAPHLTFHSQVYRQVFPGHGPLLPEH
jgi:hypothetical protein